MRCQTLDVFSDLSAWSAIAPGQAQLTLDLDRGPGDRPGLRLDFAFGTGGGFVVARRPLSLTLPGSFALHAQVRLQGRARGIELKLIDPSNENVWLWRAEPFEPGKWRALDLNARAFAFGWGPAGGGAPQELGAIEIAILGGGQGRLWLADLWLEDRTPPERPMRRRPDESGVFQATGSAPPAFELDCGAVCDYSALYLIWDSDGPHPFRVLAKDQEDEDWRCLYEAPQAQGRQNAVYLAEGCSRLLRVELIGELKGPLPELIDYRLLPAAYARSREEFLQRQALDAPLGFYPRWLYREQLYWTAIDRPQGQTPALISEDGAIEVGRGWPLIEPLLWTGERLLTWADCTIEQRLYKPPLPIPQVIWEGAGWRLAVVAFAQGEPGWLLIGYRLERLPEADQGLPPPAQARLYVLLRPFQVTPPWQRHRDSGGMAPIQRLFWDGQGLWADGRLCLLPLVRPSGAGVACFDQGPLVERIAAGRPPGTEVIHDPNGLGEAALWFDLALTAGETQTIWLAAPLEWQQAPPAVAERRVDERRVNERSEVHQEAPPPVEQGRVDERRVDERSEVHHQALSLSSVEDRLEQSLADWSKRLGAVQMDLPGPAQPYWETAQVALAHILINRKGPALQPGPRRYARSWIRDGAVMGAALNRFGLVEDALDFVAWYAGFQDPSGRVPCCVDDQGPDWLVEHDSPGQLIFAIADVWRFGAERARIASLWPSVCRAAEYLERVRAERLTPDYLEPSRRACYGLLPESASHEGYLAHPVHAYWDDLWALRGLKDAAILAEALGEQGRARQFAQLHDELAAALYASIERVMAEQGLDHLPASVELADHDPTALAVALTLVDEGHRLPPAALHRTFDRFMERLRAMHGQDPVPWTNYTPYEIRIAGALIRLGRRAEAQELLDLYLAASKPLAWHQWPEIIWRDPRAPAHLGDLPHSWIGAEYALAFRDLFVYERAADSSLVVAGGIPLAWLQAGPIRIQGLPTPYGRLDLELERWEGGALRLRLGGELSVPPGGLWVCPPLPGPLFGVQLDGQPSRDFGLSGVHLRRIPAELELLA